MFLLLLYVFYFSGSNFKLEKKKKNAYLENIIHVQTYLKSCLFLSDADYLLVGTDGDEPDQDFSYMSPIMNSVYSCLLNAKLSIYFLD